MPRGDKTGPNGEGPMTGRQQGYCSGNDSPGYAVGQGKGFCKGFRKGFGNGRRFGRNSEYNPRGELRPRDRSRRGFGRDNIKDSENSNYQNSEILEKLGNIEKRLDDLEN